MRKLFSIICLLFSLNIVVATEVELPDDVEDTLREFITLLNGEDENVYNLIDSNNNELRLNIERQIDDMYVDLIIKKIEIVTEGHYRVKTRLEANGRGWNISGLNVYYDIKLVDGRYVVSDTDLFNYIGFKNVFKIIGKFFKLIFSIFGILFLIMTVCGVIIFFIIRNNENKKTNNTHNLLNENKSL